MRELRVALRRLRCEPLFVAGVVATLGIGIGASTVMFGILDGLLLQPPAHLAQPQRVVRLFFAKQDPILGRSVSPASNYPTFADLSAGVPQFVGVASYALARETIGRNAAAARATVAFVSARYFPVLGTRPAVGHFFWGTTNAGGAPHAVAVVSYRFWQQHFGGERSAVGRVVPIGGRMYTVVGIAPRRFTGAEDLPVDAWVPLDAQSRPGYVAPSWRTDRQSLWLSIIARLRPGASRSLASEVATTVVRRQNAAISPRDTSVSVMATSTIPGRSPDRPAAVDVALWLGGISVLVMLLACANVAALLLARAMRRRRDVAVRVAIGARTRDLARTLLTEAGVLAFLTALTTLALVWSSTRLVQRLLLPNVQWPASALAPRTVWAALGVAFVAAIVVSYLPLRRVLRSDLSGALAEGARAGGGGPSRVNGVLLGFQSAVCTVLVFGALLFARSLHRVEGLDLGVDVDHTVMLAFHPDRFGETGRAMQPLYEELLRRATKLRGVDHAALAEANPYMFGRAMAPYTNETSSHALWKNREVPYIVAVGSGFFSSVGADSLRGRDFNASDRLGSELVTIIDAPLARVLWPGRDPVGRCLRLDDGRCATVVGVLHGVWKFSILARKQLTLFVPLAQDTSRNPGALFLLARAHVARVERSLRRAAAQVAPDLPPPQVSLMRDAADPQYRPWRLGATMLTAFGIIALVITSVGLYSLVWYAAIRRRHEIGVRVALGAPAHRIVRAPSCRWQPDSRWEPPRPFSGAGGRPVSSTAPRRTIPRCWGRRSRYSFSSRWWRASCPSPAS